MFNDPLASLIARAARQHGLPIPLVTAIVQVESGGDPWAARYEPAFFTRYVEKIRVRAFGGCSADTERSLRATSFGLMQIMGQVARERGFEGPYLTELCDPEVGLEYGCRHLAWLRGRYFATDGWPGVIAAYNAGAPRRDGDRYANQSYVNRALEAAQPWVG